MGERGSQEGRSVGTWVGGCQGREGPGMAVVNGDRVHGNMNVLNLTELCT